MIIKSKYTSFLFNINDYYKNLCKTPINWKPKIALKRKELYLQYSTQTQLMGHLLQVPLNEGDEGKEQEFDGSEIEQ